MKIVVRPFSGDIFNPKFQVGGEKITTMFTPRPAQEKVVEKQLFGEATFTNSDGKLQLAELKVDKAVPEFAELVKLFVS